MYKTLSKAWIGLILSSLILFPNLSVSQVPIGEMKVDGTVYTTFSEVKKADLVELSKFSNSQVHPEYGILPFNTPCEDCIELIEERTQYSRKYLRNGKDGSEFLIQQGYSPLHYKNSNDQWITYNPNIKDLGNGVYGTSNDYYSLRIDSQNGFVYFENFNQGFDPITFHQDLEIEYLNSDNTFSSSLQANWSNVQAGDGGVIVTNIFPHIDLEIAILSDIIKTSFIVNENVGNFRIKEGLSSSVSDRIPQNASQLNIVELFENGQSSYQLGQIKLYGKGAEQRKYVPGYYSIENSVLNYNWDLSEFADLDYPVIIDPTVTSTGTLPQGSIIGAGTFANNGAFTTGCTYNLAVATPANCTITDIDWSFAYIAQNGATMSEGACKFYYGACVSPATAGFFWFCNNTVAGGTCTGTNVSIFADFATCVPAPQCAPYNMNFTMEFYDVWGAFNAFNCDPTFITAGSNWTMVITGETVDEPTPPTSSAPGNTICQGSATNLTASAVFGVSPYSYSWDNGGGVGNPVSVSPGVTTTYTCTITDACGITASNNITITVVPAPDAGTNNTVSFCPSDPITSLFGVLGGTPDAGGTWAGPSALTGGSAGNFNPATMSAGVYTYTVNGSAPCTPVNATVTVTMNTPPNAGTNGAISFCPSDPNTDLFASLGGAPMAGGTWAPAMASGTGVFNPGTDPAGTYTYTITNSCGSASADVVVTMNAAPNAGTNGAISLCTTDPSTNLFTQLGGTPSAGGTWAPAMASGTGFFNPAVDPGGTYTYTVTNLCGSISADVVVTINPSPNAGTNGAISFCPTDPNTDLFNSLGGTPQVGGTWAPAMASGTGVFNPGTDPAGTYTYTVTNGCGSVSADVIVTMNPAPNAGTNGTLTICLSDPSTDLFNELGGTPSAGGTWAPAMASGTGVFNPAVDAGGTYTYTVTNVCGSISADVVVTVISAPSAGTNGAISFCPSDPVTNLFNSLGGAPDPGGTWAPAMSSGTGFFNPALDAGGTYTYTVTASCGTASADVVVTLNPAPNAGTNGAISFCSTDPSADLFASLGGAPNAGGTWSPAMTSGTGVFNPALDAAGTYTYTVTNICGSISADVVVTLNPAPNAGTNGAIAFCSSDPSTDLFASLGGTPQAGGTWAPAMTSGTGVFNPALDAAATYTYTVTNGCGSVSADVVVTLNPSPNAGTNGAVNFCPGDPSSDLFAELGGTPNAGGTWAPAMTSGTGVFNPSTDAAGTYTYTVTNGCGSVSADVVVTITANPDPGTNGAISFCPTDAATDLFASLGGTPNAGGTWSPAMASGTGVFNPALDAGGVYTYSIAACGGGFNTATVTVTMNPAPNAGSNGAITFCLGDPTADLFASLGGTPGVGGTWAPVLSSGTGVFNPAIDLGGTYTYTVTNSCGSISADVVVTVNSCSLPDVGFIISNTSICIGDCITLTDTSLFNPTSWAWDFGGAATPNTSTSQNPTICPDAAGVFTISLTATNANGSNTITQTISVGSYPTVFILGDTTIEMSGTATLVSLVNPTGGTYSWSDGDDDGTIDCPTCPDVNVTPLVSTEYYLTYTTAFGCSATDTANVYVKFLDLIDVPNGFSPNSDGMNDILFVKGEGLKTMHFVIYNRYGQKLFESDNQGIGWDGTFLGVPENPGVFAWYLEYSLLDGTSNFKKGNVTLIK